MNQQFYSLQEDRFNVEKLVHWLPYSFIIMKVYPAMHVGKFYVLLALDLQLKKKKNIFEWRLVRLISNI